MSLFKQDRLEVVERKRLEIVERKRLLSNGVGHYEIEARENTSPKDFLSKAENLLGTFLSDHPQNKIQIRLICEMMKEHFEVQQHSELCGMSDQDLHRV